MHEYHICDAFCYEGLTILLLLKQVKKMIVHAVEDALDPNARLVDQHTYVMPLDQNAGQALLV